MKAIVYYDCGSPDALQCEEIEKPVPKDDEVLIRVPAASVNPYDWHFMRGTPYPSGDLTGSECDGDRHLLRADVAKQCRRVWGCTFSSGLLAGQLAGGAQRLLRYPLGIGGKGIGSHVHSDKILVAPPSSDVRCALLRRLERPNAVVHETSCEQVHR
jgi:NADPH:quinone reductase-like Zn-dependent oxidoreductase